MKTCKRGISALLAAGMLTGAALGASGAVLPASANSAPAHWEGSAGHGAAAVGVDCPVEVERETLTLHIPDLPATSYASQEEFLAYRSNAEAAYTFYNPTQEDLDVTLAFPFGEAPDYAYDSTNTEESMPRFDDTSRYTITANGHEVEREVRYTAPYLAGFDVTDYISDEKREHSFFTPGLAVRSYTIGYSAADLPSGEEVPGVFLSVMLSYSPRRTRIAFPTGRDMYSWHVRDGEYELLFRSFASEEPCSATFWAFGEEPAVTARLYSPEEAYASEREPLATLAVSPEETTFAAFAEENRPSFIGETDYYNALLCQLDAGAFGNGAIGFDFLKEKSEFSRWYVYSLHIPAETSVENVVRAPFYPSIEHGSYSYCYYLSPAQNWASFGTFDLVIETNFAVANCSLPLKKTQQGYEYSREGLPLGELTFTMYDSTDYDGFFDLDPDFGTAVGRFAAALLLFRLISFGLQAIAGMIVWLVYRSRRKRRKDGEK